MSRRHILEDSDSDDSDAGGGSRSKPATATKDVISRIFTAEETEAIQRCNLKMYTKDGAYSEESMSRIIERLMETSQIELVAEGKGVASSKLPSYQKYRAKVGEEKTFFKRDVYNLHNPNARSSSDRSDTSVFEEAILFEIELLRRSEKAHKNRMFKNKETGGMVVFGPWWNYAFHRLLELSSSNTSMESIGDYTAVKIIRSLFHFITDDLNDVVKPGKLTAAKNAFGVDWLRNITTAREVVNQCGARVQVLDKELSVVEAHVRSLGKRSQPVSLVGATANVEPTPVQTVAGTTGTPSKPDQENARKARLAAMKKELKRTVAPPVISHGAQSGDRNSSSGGPAVHGGVENVGWGRKRDANSSVLSTSGGQTTSSLNQLPQEGASNHSGNDNDGWGRQRGAPRIQQRSTGDQSNERHSNPGGQALSTSNLMAQDTIGWGRNREISPRITGDQSNERHSNPEGQALSTSNLMAQDTIGWGRNREISPRITGDQSKERYSTPEGQAPSTSNLMKQDAIGWGKNREISPRVTGDQSKDRHTNPEGQALSASNLMTQDAIGWGRNREISPRATGDQSNDRHSNPEGQAPSASNLMAQDTNGRERNREISPRITGDQSNDWHSNREGQVLSKSNRMEPDAIGWGRNREISPVTIISKSSFRFSRQILNYNVALPEFEIRITDHESQIQVPPHGVRMGGEVEGKRSDHYNTSSKSDNKSPRYSDSKTSGRYDDRSYHRGSSREGEREDYRREDSRNRRDDHRDDNYHRSRSREETTKYDSGYNAQGRKRGWDQDRNDEVSRPQKSVERPYEASNQPVAVGHVAAATLGGTGRGRGSHMNKPAWLAKQEQSSATGQILGAPGSGDPMSSNGISYTTLDAPLPHNDTNPLLVSQNNGQTGMCTNNHLTYPVAPSNRNLANNVHVSSGNPAPSAHSLATNTTHVLGNEMHGMGRGRGRGRGASRNLPAWMTNPSNP